MANPHRIFIGWDRREDIAYQVCKYSMRMRATTPVAIQALRQDSLRARGLYWRDADPLASTEFTYTRFLLPALTGYQGWALFCDCDFLWLSDVAELFARCDDRFAIMCTKHDYRPTETVKMDGQTQTRYPRKNWSSMVLYNCGHPANAALTPKIVNEKSGAFLHRFQWLDDDQIGAIPESWNWLEGWSRKPLFGTPHAVHYTRGGPWFKEWHDVAYADAWHAERDQYEKAVAAAA